MQTHESTPRPARLPAPTYTPAIVALALVVMAWGAVTTIALVVLGVVLLAVGVAGWMMELRRD
jgi:hypothetical protein